MRKIFRLVILFFFSFFLLSFATTTTTALATTTSTTSTTPTTTTTTSNDDSFECGSSFANNPSTVETLAHLLDTPNDNMTSTEYTYRIVLVRHGESTWNQENRFCGWHDADLSEKGVGEAKSAGESLKKEKFTFDVAYTSVLKRAIKTLFFIQESLDLQWIPVTRTWRLNERMYGGLQGLNKAETAAKHGEDQVQIWRRSYDIPPPAVEESDERFPGNDRRYAHLDPKVLPKTECLKDTVARFLPVWHDSIVPDIKAGKRVLIAAHGNSLRALVKYLDNVSDSEIVELNIPTGIPLVYELDAKLRPIRHYYLADEAVVKAAQAAVAAQGKAK